jgi:hypothetical protein
MLIMICKKFLPLDHFKYLLHYLCEFISYVSSDSLLELGAFQPGDPNINTTLAYTMSKGGFLNLVPKIDLQKGNEKQDQGENQNNK